MIAGFGPGSPEQRATGTSTGGVRTPPSAMPSASRAIAGGRVGGHLEAGRLAAACPSRTQVSSARNAAFATTCERAVVDRRRRSRCLGASRRPGGVGVGGAGDLPQPEAVAVGLAGARRVEDAGDVALGLEVEDGRVEVGRGRSWASPPIAPAMSADSPGPTSGRLDAAAAVHEEAVEGLRQRLHAVVVGHERERRLRLAGRDEHVLRLQRRRCPRRCAAPGRPACRCRTSSRRRDARASRSAPGRSPSGPCPRASAPASAARAPVRPRRRCSCAETPTHAWPWRMISSCEARVLGVGVDAAADVQPLDDDGAAEVGGVRRAPHEDPRAVRRRRRRARTSSGRRR